MASSGKQGSLPGGRGDSQPLSPTIHSLRRATGSTLCLDDLHSANCGAASDVVVTVRIWEGNRAQGIFERGVGKVFVACFRPHCNMTASRGGFPPQFSMPSCNFCSVCYGTCKFPPKIGLKWRHTRRKQGAGASQLLPCHSFSFHVTGGQTCFDDFCSTNFDAGLGCPGHCEDLGRKIGHMEFLSGKGGGCSSFYFCPHCNRIDRYSISDGGGVATDVPPQFACLIVIFCSICSGIGKFR